MSAQPMGLRPLGRDLGHELEQIRRLPPPAQPNGTHAAVMQIAWRCLRRRGIVRLLADADRDGFFADLEQSALLRWKLLSWTSGQQAEDELAGPCHLSELGPFFDALASGRAAIAADIARASEAPLNRRYEYEEDYRYAQCLFALVQGADAAALEPLLLSFRAAAEADETSRYQACSALVSQDPEAFEAALERLIEEHEELYSKLGEGIVVDPEGFATEQFVMIEGLGLKVLATLRGMSPAPEHRFMPADACNPAPVRG